MFFVEPADRALSHGRRAMATVLATRFLAFARLGDVRQVVARAVTEALDAAGAESTQVRVVVATDAEGALGRAEQEGLTDALAGHHPAGPQLRELIGDTSAASSAFQLAAALVDGGEGLAVVTSVDPDGTVGCAVLCIGTGPCRTSEKGKP